MCCQGTAPFPLCTLLDLQGLLWVEVKHIWKGLIQMALVSEEGGSKSDPPWGKGAEVIGGQNAEYYYSEKVKKKITSNVCLRIRSPDPTRLVCQILHEAT